MEEVDNMDAVYRLHAQTVYRYLLGLCHSPHLAEELTQETFYRAVCSSHRYNGGCKVSVWLCQIAKHLWYQELDRRRRRRAEPLDENLPDNAPNTEAAVLQQDDKLALYRAIRCLPAAMQEVVHMRLSGALSFAEIGQVLGKSENWAQVTFYRARQKLAETMPREDE